jgi:hypothetical protein
MSADIIPFPTRAAAVPDAAVPDAVTDTAGQERLRQALASLEEALAGQRLAVAEWRRSLAQLGDTMGGLRGSLVHYRGSLNRLEQQVGALNTQAVTPEQWADKTVVSGKE